MIRIARLLHPENMAFDVAATCKKQALLKVAKLLATSSNMSESAVFKALADREKLGSTGFGHGTAVPHARLSQLGTTQAAFIRLVRPVDFEASDDEPVDLICAIIGPEGPTTEPFEALVSACRSLRNQETVSRLRKAGSAVAIHEALAEGA